MGYVESSDGVKMFLQPSVIVFDAILSRATAYNSVRVRRRALKIEIQSKIRLKPDLAYLRLAGIWSANQKFCSQKSTLSTSARPRMSSGLFSELENVFKRFLMQFARQRASRDVRKPKTVAAVPKSRSVAACDCRFYS